MASLARLAKSVLEPPPYHLGPPWLNRAGWQMARVIPHHLRHSIRHSIGRGIGRSLGRTAPAAVAGLVAAGERDGIVVIPDFLPASDFQRLKRYCEGLGAHPSMRREDNREGSGVDWLYGPIAGEDAETLWVRESIAQNPLLLGAVAGMARRRITRSPQLGYQRLAMRDDAPYVADAEAVLHADRHFPTIKAYYSLNASTEENGAYVWVYGSHLLTLARLRHEYAYSIRQALFTHGRAERLPPGAVEAGMVKIDAKHREAMGVKEQAILTAENTMVISNNFGFHRRGYFKPGAVREQIRLVFHYLEEPIYATWLWSGMAALNARRLLPEAVRRAVQYRLT
jgi:hypothetical protein